MEDELGRGASLPAHSLVFLPAPTLDIQRKSDSESSSLGYFAVKTEFILERDVRFLDLRIRLLIQNLMALDEVSWAE